MIQRVIYSFYVYISWVSWPRIQYRYSIHHFNTKLLLEMTWKVGGSLQNKSFNNIFTEAFFFLPFFFELPPPPPPPPPIFIFNGATVFFPLLFFFGFSSIGASSWGSVSSSWSSEIWTFYFKMELTNNNQCS